MRTMFSSVQRRSLAFQRAKDSDTESLKITESSAVLTVCSQEHFKVRKVPETKSINSGGV